MQRQQWQQQQWQQQQQLQSGDPMEVVPRYQPPGKSQQNPPPLNISLMRSVAKRDLELKKLFENSNLSAIWIKSFLFMIDKEYEDIQTDQLNVVFQSNEPVETLKVAAILGTPKDVMDKNGLPVDATKWKITVMQAISRIYGAMYKFADARNDFTKLQEVEKDIRDGKEVEPNEIMNALVMADNLGINYRETPHWISDKADWEIVQKTDDKGVPTNIMQLKNIESIIIPSFNELLKLKKENEKTLGTDKIKVDRTPFEKSGGARLAYAIKSTYEKPEDAQKLIDGIIGVFGKDEKKRYVKDIEQLNQASTFYDTEKQRIDKLQLSPEMSLAYLAARLAIYASKDISTYFGIRTDKKEEKILNNDSINGRFDTKDTDFVDYINGVNLAFVIRTLIGSVPSGTDSLRVLNVMRNLLNLSTKPYEATKTEWMSENVLLAKKKDIPLILTFSYIFNLFFRGITKYPADKIRQLYLDNKNDVTTSNKINIDTRSKYFGMLCVNFMLRAISKNIVVTLDSKKISGKNTGFYDSSMMLFLIYIQYGLLTLKEISVADNPNLSKFPDRDDQGKRAADGNIPDFDMNETDKTIITKMMDAVDKMMNALVANKANPLPLIPDAFPFEIVLKTKMKDVTDLETKLTYDLNLTSEITKTEGTAQTQGADIGPEKLYHKIEKKIENSVESKGVDQKGVDPKTVKTQNIETPMCLSVTEPDLLAVFADDKKLYTNMLKAMRGVKLPVTKQTTDEVVYKLCLLYETLLKDTEDVILKDILASISNYKKQLVEKLGTRVVNFTVSSKVLKNKKKVLSKFSAWIGLFLDIELKELKSHDKLLALIYEVSKYHLIHQ